MLLLALCGDKYIDIPPANHGTAPETINMPSMGQHYVWIIYALWGSTIDW